MERRLISHLGPIFIVCLSLMDPGKWAIAMEGGSRIGMDLLWALVASCVLAGLLHSLTFRLGFATGRNLAQVFSESYPAYISTLLWLHCEISNLILNLNMIFGVSMGVNALVGLPMVWCVASSSVDILIFRLALPQMGLYKVEVSTASVIGVVLFCFVLEGFYSNINMEALFLGMLPKLKGENLYIVAGILAANVVPSNLYLCSTLLQDVQHANTCKHGDFLFHGIIDIVTGYGMVLLVNVAVLSSAAAAFHNWGHIVITLQDAQALIEQITRDSITPWALCFAMLCAGQLWTLQSTTAACIAAEEILGVNISITFHRVITKLIAIMVAVLLIWGVGVDSLYQVVIFSQGVLALLLPVTVIPLVKITSSELIMGKYKISSLVEMISWVVIGTICVMDMWVVFDMLLGETDEYMEPESWNFIGNLVNANGKWVEMMQVPCCLFLVGVMTLWLLPLTWLIFTPVQGRATIARECAVASLLPMKQECKQEQTETSTQEFDEDMWDMKCISANHELSLTLTPNEIEDSMHTSDELSGIEKHIQSVVVAPSEFLRAIDDEEIMEKCLVLEESTQDTSSLISVKNLPLIMAHPQAEQSHVLEAQQSQVNEGNEAPLTKNEDALSVTESEMSLASKGIHSVLSLESKSCTQEMFASTESGRDTKTDSLKDAEKDLELLDKGDYYMEEWESLEQDLVPDPLSGISGSVSSSIFEEPLSGKSFGARSDTSEGSCGGSGSGSLSRLSGLGRSARRQFAALLDEFWGKLYDLHGQLVNQSQGKSRGGRTSRSVVNLSGKTNSFDSGLYPSKPVQKSWPQTSQSDFSSSLDASMHLNYHGVTSNAFNFDSSYYQDSFAYDPCIQDTNEKRLSSLRYLVTTDGYDSQPSTVHGYTHSGRNPRSSFINGSPYITNKRHHFSYSPFGTEMLHDNGSMYGFPMVNTSVKSNVNKTVASSCMQSFLSAQHTCEPINRTARQSLIIDGLEQEPANPDYSPVSSSWNYGDDISAWDSLVYRATGELDMPSHLRQEFASSKAVSPSPITVTGQKGNFKSRMQVAGENAPLAFDQISPSNSLKNGYSFQASQNHSLWATQPFEQLFGFSTSPVGSPNPTPKISTQYTTLDQPADTYGSHHSENNQEIDLLISLRLCICKLLKLDGSDWLFRMDSGYDEDLIGVVASRERILLEADTRELYKQYVTTEHVWNGRFGTAARRHNEPMGSSLGSLSIPHCGEGCAWNMELLVSFGIWCIHRILELALMESRPELWGKYTYVLNRLQGVLDPAFSKTRSVSTPCLCMAASPDSISAGQKNIIKDNGVVDLRRSLLPGIPGQVYSQSWQWGQDASTSQGHGSSSVVFLEMIREVEVAIEGRKGRTGTAAGDVAFPKGKENLASVLKRYKRRLGGRSIADVASHHNGGNYRSSSLYPLFVQLFQLAL